MKVEYTYEELIEACKNAKCKNDIYSNLGRNKPNSSTISKIKKMFEEHSIDIDKIIFDNVYKEKTCPVCKNKFVVSRVTDNVKPKHTCSYSCSNTHFRTGENNGSYKSSIIRNGGNDINYRRICFKYHKKQCIVCYENKMVAVHHYDENHENNDPDNLIPLCPTHHGYVHSKYKYLVQNLIDKYITEWKNNHKQ